MLGRCVLTMAMRIRRKHLAALVNQFPEQTVAQMIEFVVKNYLGLDLTVRPR